MFPLGNVLFPGFGLPLHVFEPRYRSMVETLISQDDPEFGVTLIERGSEVGGGDRRFNVGTIARIVEAGQLPDGRWVLETAGVARCRVLEWLPDAPYPQAVIERLDNDDYGPMSGTMLVGEIDAAVKDLRRVLALAAEADMPSAPATIVLDDDPEVRLWQACGLAPIGPMDDFTLLSADTLTDRVNLLRGFLEDARVLLANRLASG
jgi:uncharacterized protein